MSAVGTAVTLGALLELSWSENGALPLAVERVNADPMLLPGRTLEYKTRYGGCQISGALQGLGELTSDGNHIDAVLGPPCSGACETTGYLTTGQNLAHISHSCTSYALSNTANYPTVPCPLPQFLLRLSIMMYICCSSFALSRRTQAKCQHSFR